MEIAVEFQTEGRYTIVGNQCESIVGQELCYFKGNLHATNKMCKYSKALTCNGTLKQTDAVARLESCRAL